jgi:hypothetical protein
MYSVAVDMMKMAIIFLVHMVSDKFKTIFVHVPKAAGQSIERVFLQEHGLTWATRSSLLLRFNGDPKSGPERLAHLYAREYVELGYVSEEKFRRYFKFAVVRHPRDRLVSAYRFRYSRNMVSFADFVRALPEDLYSGPMRHLCPQHLYLCEPDGRLIVDQVLRYENIDAEFGAVSARLFGKSITLPRSNVSSSAIPHVDRAMQEMIFRRYERDFKLFGYRQ